MKTAIKNTDRVARQWTFVVFVAAQHQNSFWGGGRETLHNLSLSNSQNPPPTTEGRKADSLSYLPLQLWQKYVP